MSDKAVPADKGQQPYDKNHPQHPDFTGNNPGDLPAAKGTDAAPDRPSVAEQQHKQNQHAEQQLKQQEHQQEERNAFPKGNAQEHQQGNQRR